MDIFKISDMRGGWFIGDFNPSILKTKEFEVAYMRHKKGDIWPKHVHKVATEYNLLVRGQEKINGIILNAGDLFIIHKNETSEVEFLTDCELIVVKVPSVIGDKYIL